MDSEKIITDFEELLEYADKKAVEASHDRFFKVWSHHTFARELITAVGKHQILNWLGQFKTQRDKAVAISILEKIQYYDASMVMDLCRLGYIQWSVKNKTTFKNAVFIPLGGVGKSGQMIGYLFRTANSIPVSQLCSELDMDTYDLSKVAHAVFLDDFSGTGDQFIKNKCVQMILNKISTSKSKKCPTLSFIPLVIMEDAKKKIENELAIDVISQQIRWKSRLSENELDVVERYGKGLFIKKGKDMYMGWGDVAETIVFYHNVPNNTLPIIWSSNNSRETGKEWIPLFHRTFSNANTVTGVRTEAQTLFNFLQNKQLFSEDYIIYLRIISDIYAVLNEDTFTFPELKKLLTIASSLMYPYQEISQYHTPFAFIQNMRLSCVDIINRKAERMGILKKSDFIDLVNLFSVDNNIVDQGCLINTNLAKVVSKVIQKNREHIKTALEYVNVPTIKNEDGYIDGELIFKIYGVFSAILFAFELFEADTDEISLLKQIRRKAENESVRYSAEILLSKIEKRLHSFSDINLDLVYKVYNCYGKYIVTSVNSARSMGL